MGIRFLHLADSHLGARHPGREPGDPFTENLHRALSLARRGEVELVLHAGDLFQRSRPPVRLVSEASGMLQDAAEGGAHVVVVAGNHERSVQPCRLLLAHPRVHFLEGPSRLSLQIDGAEVSVFGFPFLRKNSRGRFEAVLRETGWPRGRGDLAVLLCHQTFDGATVGPSDYTFRGGPDVIPRAFVPVDLDYAALGHIHRHQHLRHPRSDRLRLSYAGSTERTSRAERNEEKGYLMGTLVPGEVAWPRFVILPTRPLPPPRARPWATGGTRGTRSWRGAR